MRKLQSESFRARGLEDVFPRVNLSLADGDGMHDGDDGYYLQAGAGALALMHLSLGAAGKPASSPKRILDYACGYGRVLRWLRAAYPSADLVAADTDKKALAAVRSLLDVQTVALDRSLTESIGTFDLIWVGSLITHLPVEGVRAHLLRFKGLLSNGGVLVFTTHGPYVADRIRRGEKLYGLNERGVKALLEGYADTGFGFGAKHVEHYGVSVCQPAAILSLVASAGLDALLYQARGWVYHQDVVAASCTQAPPLR